MRVVALFAGVVASAIVSSVAAQAAGPLPAVEPQEVGFSVERLNRIEEFFNREIAQNRVPGAVIGIARDGEPKRLLVAEQGGRRAGFAVDEVTDVGVLADVEEATESEYLAGAALDDGELVGVVDLERVFAALALEGA